MRLQNPLKNLLKIRGITARDIADISGFERSTIQRAIDGSRRSQKPRQAIADYLNVSYESLWGPFNRRHVKKLTERAIEDRAKRVSEQEKLRLAKSYLTKSVTSTQKVSNG